VVLAVVKSGKLNIIIVLNRTAPRARGLRRDPVVPQDPGGRPGSGGHLVVFPPGPAVLDHPGPDAVAMPVGDPHDVRVDPRGDSQVVIVIDWARVAFLVSFGSLASPEFLIGDIVISATLWAILTMLYRNVYHFLSRKTS